MYEFKQGDRVKIINKSYPNQIFSFEEFKKTRPTCDFNYALIESVNVLSGLETRYSIASCDFRAEDLIPVNSKNMSQCTSGSLKEKFVLLTTKEPEKTYRKAGLVDGDNILNDEGAKIFLTWLLGKNPEFKTEVADALVEQETK